MWPQQFPLIKHKIFLILLILFILGFNSQSKWGGNRLNFLDVTIINNNNDVEFDWFHKPTFSGRYLNFYSQHPLSQKRDTAMGMIDRAFILSHPKYHKKN
jgi:hypothetical protein